MKSDKDSCILHRKNGEGTTLIAVTVDEFLVLGSEKKMIEKFYTAQSKKYTVKLLGNPNDFLGWTIPMGAMDHSRSRKPLCILPKLPTPTLRDYLVAICRTTIKKICARRKVRRFTFPEARPSTGSFSGNGGTWPTSQDLIHVMPHSAQAWD